MSEIVLDVPEGWLAAMGSSPEQFARYAKTASAMKLYELGRLSSGQAAQLAGMNRVQFLLSCHEWGVPSVTLDDSECEAEFLTALP